MSASQRGRLDTTSGPEESIRLCLLGEARLMRGAGVVETIGTRRMQSLVAYLALHRDTPVDRGLLAATLWPDSTDEQARTNLRNQLHLMRHALPLIDEHLTIDRSTIQWNTGALLLDVAEFERAVERAASAREHGDLMAEQAALADAIAAYHGDLLPGLYDDWALAERQRLRQMLIAALRRSAEIHESLENDPRAIAHLEMLLRLDPADESTYERLMRVHERRGDRAAALRAYHTCATALEDELGATPGPAVTEMYRRLLAAGTGPVQEPPAASAAHTPLVGRSDEWERLLAIWHSATEGHPQMVVLSGEAGIGKTRIAEDLLAWITRQGHSAISARCFAAEGALPYAPITAWLRSDVVQSILPRLEDTWLTEVARLLPEIHGEWPDLARPVPIEEDWQRQRLFDGLARAMHAVRQPLALLIDDLQWCDRDTLEWLHYLLRSKPDAALLVIGTLRPEELTPDHPLVTLVLTLHRHRQITEISLPLFGEDETASLAAHLLGTALPSGDAHRLYRESEGNPLFIVEMVRARQAGQSDDASSSPTIQSVIRDRFARLSPSATSLLEAAAVIGRNATVERLSAMSGASEDEVINGLDELWRRRILRERSGVYSFTHEQLREVAYGELGPARRRILHRRAAEIIERESADAPQVAARDLAMHFDRAGMPEPAATYYLRAGNHARDVYANRDAIALYQQGLAQLLDGEPGDPQVGQQLYSRLGDVLRLTGNARDARAAYQHAIEGCQAGDHRSVTQLRLSIAHTWSMEGRYRETLTECMAAESLLGEDPDDRELRFEIQLERLRAYYGTGDWQSMQATASAIDERDGTPRQRLAFARLWRGAMLRRDRYVVGDDLLAHAEAVLATAQSTADPILIAEAEFALGFCYLWRHELAHAAVHLERGLSFSERVGHHEFQVLCLTYLAVAQRRLGNDDAARQHAERALSLTTSISMPTYAGAAKANLAWLAQRAGQPETAESLAREALGLWQGSVYPFQWLALWPLIELSLDSGDIDGARSCAAQLLDASQMRLTPEIEASLSAALQADDPGDGLRFSLERARALGLS